MKKRKATVYRGTGADYKSLGGVETNTDVYIFSVTKTATIEDLKDYVSTNLKLTVVDLSVVSDETWNTKSFKLSVPVSQLDTALNAAWPTGICVRRWRYVPRKRADCSINNNS